MWGDGKKIIMSHGRNRITPFMEWSPVWSQKFAKIGGTESYMIHGYITCYIIRITCCIINGFGDPRFSDTPSYLWWTWQTKKGLHLNQSGAASCTNEYGPPRLILQDEPLDQSFMFPGLWTALTIVASQIISPVQQYRTNVKHVNLYSYLEEHQGWRNPQLSLVKYSVLLVWISSIHTCTGNFDLLTFSRVLWQFMILDPSKYLLVMTNIAVETDHRNSELSKLQNGGSFMIFQ